MVIPCCFHLISHLLKVKAQTLLVAFHVYLNTKISVFSSSSHPLIPLNLSLRACMLF